MFSVRLNMLFEDALRTGRPVTQTQVAQTLNARGYQISQPYISQLCRGVREHPSPSTVAALAEYFHVDDDYFFRPIEDTRAPAARIVIHGLADPSLRRLLAHANGLSEDSIGLVVDMAERLRRTERLREIWD